jgi:alcohol dehydrogenase
VQQLTYAEPGVMRWEQVPDPVLDDPRGALVAPLAVARCDLDMAMAAFGLFPGPFAVGHEAVAEVTAIGADVASFEIGQRVLVPFQLSCGTCIACTERRFGACHSFRAPAGGAFGFGPAGGGHGGAVADLLYVPAADHLLLPAPAGLPVDVLCTLPDNVVDAYRTVAGPLQASPGAEVLIVGGAAQSIGLYAVAMAMALGSRRVRYVDVDQERGAAAEKLGAETTIHAGTWPRRFERAPITVDNTGDEEGLACTLRSTDDYGYCTGVATHFTDTTSIPLLHMYTKGITFHVSRADSRRLLPDVIDLVASGRVDPAAVPTEVVPWEDAGRAWLQPAIKLVVTR